MGCPDLDAIKARSGEWERKHPHGFGRGNASMASMDRVALLAYIEELEGGIRKAMSFLDHPPSVSATKVCEHNLDAWKVLFDLKVPTDE